MSRASRRPPQPAATIELEIEAVGAQGDGIASHGGGTLFVPYTLPGDVVTVRRTGPRHAVPVAWTRRAAAHRDPACRHFGRCGGCALQHLDDDAYAAWKIGLLASALAHRGLNGVAIRPLVRTPPAARRRAELTAVNAGGAIHLGFHAVRSREVVDLGACPVLAPALEALLPGLREALRHVLPRRQAAEILLTRTETGIDVLVRGLKALDRAQRDALIAFAASHDLARIAFQRASEPADIVVQRRVPRVAFGDIAVEPPPGAFLQANVEGEGAIVEAALRAAAGARRLADLFAGCGTLTFPLARAARVHAVEGLPALTAAIDGAVRRHGLVGRVTTETRDLARRPMLAHELEGYDGVVFDPPRDGAALQAAQIAASTVTLAVAVSCHPATFARDARTLVDGGFRLVEATPIDQFLWSPHLEVVAAFRR